MKPQTVAKLLILFHVLGGGSAAYSDVVTEWNTAALNVIRADRTPPPIASRALAILHVSIYDAVNGRRSSLEQRAAGPSVMMFLHMHVPSRLQRAIHIVLITTFDFDLDSRVTDSEVVVQFFIDGAEHLLAASDRLFGNHNVATTTGYSGAYRPNMEIMDCEYSMNFADGIV